MGFSMEGKPKWGVEFKPWSIESPDIVVRNEHKVQPGSAFFIQFIMCYLHGNMECGKGLPLWQEDRWRSTH